jgi:gliding motility-associated-like protein
MLFFKRKTPDSNNIYGETPHLQNVGKPNPFRVPDHYFESFEQQIMQQIRFVKPIGPVENFFRNAASTMLKPQVAVAASLIIIIATSVLLYINEPLNKIPHAGLASSDQPETAILISENLPHGKLFMAEVNETGNAKKITIYISPDFKPEHVQFITSNYPLSLPVITNMEKNLDQYFAQNKQEAIHNEQVVKQTDHYRLTQNAPSTNNQPSVYQNIYQYHPQYQGGTVQQVNTSSASAGTTKPVVYNAEQQDTKFRDNAQNLSKLPHFALPEYVCSENAYQLKPYSINKNFRYQWSTGETTPDITIRNTGTYTLTIFDPDNKNEFVTSSSYVKIIPKPARTIPSQAVLCSGNTLRIEPEIDNPELYSYFWIPTYETTKDITIRNQGLYVLSITGCNTYYDSVLVTKEHCDIMLPNVITPNNDGINDYFYIQGLEKYPGTKLVIFDRSGNQVFATNDYQNNWSGDKLPSGTYFFIIKFYDGIEKHGTITILK